MKFSSVFSRHLELATRYGISLSTVVADVFPKWTRESVFMLYLALGIRISRRVQIIGKVPYLM